MVKPYTSRGAPGAVELMGLALATNKLTVNSLSTYRKAKFFWKEVTVNKRSAPVWQVVSVAASGETVKHGNGFVARESETFGLQSAFSVRRLRTSCYFVEGSRGTALLRGRCPEGSVAPWVTPCRVR